MPRCMKYTFVRRHQSIVILEIANFFNIRNPKIVCAELAQEGRLLKLCIYTDALQRFHEWQNLVDPEILSESESKIELVTVVGFLYKKLYGMVIGIGAFQPVG